MLNYDPKYCPFCSSTHMSYQDPEVQEQANAIHLPIKCNKCHSKWIEVFTFSNAKLENDL